MRRRLRMQYAVQHATYNVFNVADDATGHWSDHELRHADAHAMYIIYDEPSFYENDNDLWIFNKGAEHATWRN